MPNMLTVVLHRDEAVSVFYFACFVPEFRLEFCKGGLIRNHGTDA